MFDVHKEIKEKDTTVCLTMMSIRPSTCSIRSCFGAEPVYNSITNAIPFSFLFYSYLFFSLQNRKNGRLLESFPL